MPSRSAIGWGGFFPASKQKSRLGPLIVSDEQTKSAYSSAGLPNAGLPPYQSSESVFRFVPGPRSQVERVPLMSSLSQREHPIAMPIMRRNFTWMQVTICESALKGTTLTGADAPWRHSPLGPDLRSGLATARGPAAWHNLGALRALRGSVVNRGCRDRGEGLRTPCYPCEGGRPTRRHEGSRKGSHAQRQR